MARYRENVPGACRRCSGPLVRNVTVTPVWGGEEIRRESKPYCTSCTQPELAAWDREHGQQSEQ